MLFNISTFKAFIIAHNYLLCVIYTGIFKHIENTIFLYFFIWSFIGAFNVFIGALLIGALLIGANKNICVSSSSVKLYI